MSVILGIPFFNDKNVILKFIIDEMIINSNKLLNNKISIPATSTYNVLSITAETNINDNDVIVIGKQNISDKLWVGS